MAFDYGISKTGVAVGHVMTGNSMSLPPLRMIRGKADGQSLDALMKDWRPETCILGMPAQSKELSDEKKEIMQHTNALKPARNICKRVRSFADYLQRTYHIQYYFVDERLTTREAIIDRQAWELDQIRKNGKDFRVQETKSSLDSEVARIFLHLWFHEHRLSSDGRR